MFPTGWNLFVWLSLLILAAKFEDWCPPLDSTTEDSCTLIGPTDWLLAFDLSERKKRFQTEHKYNIFTEMATRMVKRLDEINRNGSLGVQHRYGSFVWDGFEETTLKFACSTYEWITFNWPSLDDLSSSHPHGRDEQTFDEAIKHQYSLCGEPNRQRIVLVFTMTIAANRSEDKSLKQLFSIEDSAVPGQVYVISLVYPSRKPTKEYIILADSVVDYPVHKLMLVLYGDYSVQQRLMNRSNHFLNCMCRQTENCQFRTTSTTKCHFIQQNADEEACVTIRTSNITFRPKNVRHDATIVCPAVNVSTPCQLPDCIADCDLKQWDSWSPCLPTVEGHHHYIVRKRLFHNDSISQDTKSCKKEERVLCDDPAVDGRLSKLHIVLIVCSVVAVLLVNVGILGVIWKRRQNKEIFVQNIREKSHQQRKYSKDGSRSSSQSVSTFGGSVVPLKKDMIMGKVEKAKGHQVEILLQHKATQAKGSSKAQPAASFEKVKEVKKGN